MNIHNRWEMLAAFAIGVVAGVLWCKDAHAQPAQYIGHAEVHDGDTIKIKGQSFRLHGIDAPELTERYGIESRDMMRAIIQEQYVLCYWWGEKSYNRLVALCATATYPDIGAELIRRGLALDCARYSHGQYRQLEPADVRSKIAQKGYCK